MLKHAKIKNLIRNKQMLRKTVLNRSFALLDLKSYFFFKNYITTGKVVSVLTGAMERTKHFFIMIL